MQFGRCLLGSAKKPFFRVACLARPGMVGNSVRSARHQTPQTWTGFTSTAPSEGQERKIMCPSVLPSCKQRKLCPSLAVGIGIAAGDLDTFMGIVFCEKLLLCSPRRPCSSCCSSLSFQGLASEGSGYVDERVFCQRRCSGRCNFESRFKLIA